MKKNHLLTGIAAVMLTGGLFTSCSAVSYTHLTLPTTERV